MKKILVLKNYISYAFKTAPLYTAYYLLLQLLSLFMPMAQIIIVSSFINNVQDIIQDGTINLQIINYILLIILSFAVSYLLKLLSKTVMISFSKAANYSFELSVVEKCSKLSYTTIENSQNNDLIEAISEKCDNAVTQGINSIMEFLHIFIRLISIVILLVKSSILISAIALVVLLILSYAAYQSGEREYDSYKIVRKHYRRARAYQSMINSRECADERRLFEYGEHVNEMWEQEYDTGRKISLKTTLINYVRIKGLSIIMAILSFAIAGILLVPLHYKTLSVGLYISIITEVFNLVQKMSWNLSDVIQELIKMKNYMLDYNEFLKLPELSGIEASRELKENTYKFKQDESLSTDTIIFRNVSFKYPNTDRYIIKNLSFQLNKGNTYAFVGENGAGKSTIIKLLLGIYKDYEGEILINNTELRSLSADSWYKFFSVVYQDFARYQISAIDNILIGKIETIKTIEKDGFSKASTADKAVSACENTDSNAIFRNLEKIIEQVGLTKVFNSLPDGLNTQLGQLEEDGHDMSGGEWQKLALARALYSDKPIQILDEPTSALDPIMEKQIYNCFYDIAKGDIKIMISHRLGGVRNADEIIVLKQGEIVERGSHQSLLEKKGIYEKMYENQRSWYHE